jgi:hypothetical protein
MLRSIRSSQLFPDWFSNQVACPLHERVSCWHGCGPGCSLSRPLLLQSSLSRTLTSSAVTTRYRGTAFQTFSAILRRPATWRLARAPSQLHTYSAAHLLQPLLGVSALASDSDSGFVLLARSVHGLKRCSNATLARTAERRPHHTCAVSARCAVPPHLPRAHPVWWAAGSSGGPSARRGAASAASLPPP